MPGDDESRAALLASIEGEFARLRQLLAGKDEAAMAERPPRAAWSVLEIVRHLLFAEQAHLGRFVPSGKSWSPLGYTPRTMQETRKLPPPDAGAPPPRVAEVMAAWEAIHAATSQALAGQDTAEVRTALARNLKHLRSHVRTIERLARTLPERADGLPS